MVPIKYSSKSNLFSYLSKCNTFVTEIYHEIWMVWYTQCLSQWMTIRPCPGHECVVCVDYNRNPLLWNRKCSIREWPSILCQSKYLLLRTRKTRVEGEWAESYLACPLDHCYCKRGKYEMVSSSRSPQGQIEWSRGHSQTLIGPSVSSPLASIGPSHPVWEAIIVIAVFSPVCCGDTLQPM